MTWSAPDDRPPRSALRRGTLLWPVLLIGAGLIFLLANLGVLPANGLWVLFRLWPAILIIIGLDILLGARWPVLSTLLALALVVGAIVLVAAAPSLAWLGLDAPPPGGIGFGTGEVRQSRFTAPVEQATSAQVRLDLGRFQTGIGPTADPELLIEAQVAHVGNMVFDVSGADRKVVLLDETDAPFFGLLIPSRDHTWDVRLTPRIPLDLVVDVGSGACTMNLETLRLEGLDVTGGSGSTAATLPPGTYPVRLDGGPGSSDLTLSAEADVTLDLEMGSGSVTVAIEDGAAPTVNLSDAGSGSLRVLAPAGTPMRVAVRDDGSGSVRVPNALDLIEGDGDDEGVWETPDYATAERRITININDMGSGSVVVDLR